MGTFYDGEAHVDESVLVEEITCPRRKCGPRLGRLFQEQLAIAVSFTREGASVEEISGIEKVVANVSFDLLIYDAKASKLVTSFPIFVSHVELRSTRPSDDELALIIGRTALEDGLVALKMQLGTLRVGRIAEHSIRVRNVSASAEVREAMGFQSAPEGLDWLAASRLSGALFSLKGVSLLPFAANHALGRLTLSFLDARTQDVQIPNESYSMDIELLSPLKEKHQRGYGGTAFLYGLYANVRTYDDELGTEYGIFRAKHAITKFIPDAQANINDVEIFKELVGEVLAKTVSDMISNKKFDQGVLSRCTIK